MAMESIIQQEGLQSLLLGSMEGSKVPTQLHSDISQHKVAPLSEWIEQHLGSHGRCCQTHHV